MLILFRGSANALLVPIAGGLFIVPYVLFSALAGQLADRLGKARLIRLTKLYEVGLMGLAAVGLLAGSEAFLLVVLFGLGVQATFFGPLKYGALPELLAPGELVAGNALIEAGTFVGILLGTILGGELILLQRGRVATSVAVLCVAAAGFLAARRVPKLAAAAPGLVVDRSVLRGTARLLGEARARPVVWASILALSWFWALGAAFLAEFPVIVKRGFGGDGQVVTLMLAVFSVGVGVGSLAAGVLLRGKISARPCVPAAIALGVFALDFAVSAGRAVPGDGWRDVPALLAHAGGWRVLVDLFAVAACGGMYSVPLYALLQSAAEPAWRARLIAANNVMNALFMVVSAVVLAAGAALHVAPAALLAGFAAADGVVVVLLWRARLP